VTITAPPDINTISVQARPYPSYLLPKEGTALALFAAGFHGWNDAIHFARQGLRGECVDVDEMKLHEMQAVYPDGWEFTVSDAFEFAEKHAGVEQWDVVSVDPFLGDMGERVLDSFYLWVSLARQLVTITVPATTRRVVNVPEGWTTSFFPRSSYAAWMVLRRA